MKKMKKYFYIAIILVGGIFVSCNDDIDDKLPGIDEAERPGNVIQHEHTFVANDFNTIISNLNAKKTKEDSLLAQQVSANKKFSEALDPAKFIPYLLPSIIKSPDVGASVAVTYQYDLGRDTVVANLSTDSYTLVSEDYATAWGDPSVDAFTPAKAPNSYLPAILMTRFGQQPIGKYKNVEYYYSEKEPTPANVVGDIYEEEPFDNNPSGTGSGKKMDIAGWTNVDLTGGTSIYWQCRTYSGNNYTQVSSYQSGALNDVWLISPQVDLTNATSPRFAFDIVAGNYNATCLKIFVSDNFDGNQANIATATWTEVTSNFTLPTPSSGYSTWASAGSMSLASYTGKKIHVAFRYEGDDLNATKKTTTYQIDNVKVYDETLGLEVESKSLVYDLYESTGTVWKKTTDNNIIILQPEDYEAMGLTYLTTEQAPNYLPIYLSQKYTYAQEGDSKKIVYRTKANTCYADEYIRTDGKWVANSFIEEKTDQFVYASTKEWIFDPTLVVTMQKGKESTDDYMMVVNYVKEHQALENPNLINQKYQDTEYYYGFSGGYGNVSYRDSDRSNDTEYAALTDADAKWDLMNRRTEQGVAVYLSLKFPNATPLTNGVVQEAKVTLFVYRDPKSDKDQNWTYRMKCIGDKQWEFVERVSASGEVNKAGEY